MVAVLAGCGANADVTGEGRPDPTQVAIGSDGSIGDRREATTTTAFVPTTTGAPPEGRPLAEPVCPPSVDAGSFASPTLGRAPSTTVPKPSFTTTTPAPGTPLPPGATPAPSTTIARAQEAVDRLRGDPRLAGMTMSLSVWEQGLGEVAAVGADTSLIPASNQKLITAIGVLSYLDPQEKLSTDVIATGPIDGGVLRGDLVVVGGGDPVLQRAGQHSVDQIAQLLVDGGVKQVDGRILVDEGRYDTARTGPGWPTDWLESIGPMSAFAVDHNMFTKDRAYVNDPAKGNGEVLKYALAVRSVPVSGGVDHGRADQGVRLVRYESPTVEKLLGQMLITSDNFIAELFVKEIAFRQTKQPGTTAAGIAAIRAALAKLCVPITSVDADGSGLSRDDRRSAREFRRLLQVAALQPWGETFVSALSISGEDGALGGRLAGPTTAGKVRAKGGMLSVSRTLSGYLTTAGGRQVVFSILLNGPLPASNRKVEDAAEEFLIALAGLPG